MSPMRIIETTAAQWGISNAVREVLRSSGSECTPEQDRSSETTCRHCASLRQTYAGAGFGVREPDADETPLSDSEKLIALRECIEC